MVMVCQDREEKPVLGVNVWLFWCFFASQLVGSAKKVLKSKGNSGIVGP